MSERSQVGRARRTECEKMQFQCRLTCEAGYAGATYLKVDEHLSIAQAQDGKRSHFYADR